MGRKPTVDPKWTPVQHSGYGYAGKPGFKQGLEPRQVTTKKEQELVLKSGGILFDNYAKCSDFCDDAMFPDEEGGMYPRAKGTFSSNEIDELAIYIPVVEVKG